MARQRRGGFKPPELRGTLGTLLRTTLQQAGVVREALERGAREGRARLDDLRADRRRQEALAELGQVVLELIRRGEIDLGELPEARSIIDHLDELDAEDAGPPDEVARPARRKRFDDREADDDGTVSSSQWSPPPRRAGRTTSVWRPVESAPESPAVLPVKVIEPPAARKGGIQFDDDGDDDLEQYMHPDDVPPKE